MTTGRGDWNGGADAGNVDSWGDATRSDRNAGAAGAGAGADGFTSQDARSGADGFAAADGGFGATAGKGVGTRGDGACRNCGQGKDALTTTLQDLLLTSTSEGHFTRDCIEPRKNSGACFNCGEEGHTKAECTQPRKFTGECRLCNQLGHPAAECSDRKAVCKNCLQEGHEALGCENAKVMDLSHVPDKTVAEAWVMLKQASDEREIGEFKEVSFNS
jgi:hypothetical protein